jgi:hypothetical protein
VLHTLFCPSSGNPTNPFLEGDRPVDSDLVREYADIFVRVEGWGGFESSDVEGNDLGRYVNGTVPDFVAEFERKLDGKPGLAPDVCCFPLLLF